MFTTEMSLAVIKFHYNITFHLVCYEEISLVLSLVQSYVRQIKLLDITVVEVENTNSSSFWYLQSTLLYIFNKQSLDP